MLWFNHFFSDQVTAGCSDRTVDFSLSAEAQPLTQAQYQYLKGFVPFALDDVRHLKQVHADQLWHITEEKNFCSSQALEGDGLLTALSQKLLAIRTADCLPVFFFDQQRKGIALAHAGWRGTLKEIALKMLLRIQDAWGSDVQNIKVVLGPCIQQCCYEVGPKFKDLFTTGLNDRFYLDLPGVNRAQMQKAGLPASNIHDCRLCTCCDKNYFSYRREGEAAGRMISFMMIPEAK